VAGQVAKLAVLAADLTARGLTLPQDFVTFQGSLKRDQQDCVLCYLYLRPRTNPSSCTPISGSRTSCGARSTAVICHGSNRRCSTTCATTPRPGLPRSSPAVPLTEVVQEAPGGGDDASGAADSIGGGADRGSGQAGQDRDGVGGRPARMAA